MSNFTDNKQPIDPKLIEKIELMRATPERDPQSVTQSRERFMSELEDMPVNGSRSPLAWLSGLLNPIIQRSEENSVSTKTQKFAYSTVVTLIVVVVMLFGGVTATAYASQSALPGDALYPIKTSLEQTQVALARDAYSQAQIYMQFAQRRLNEINELLQEGRYADVEIASGEFESQIQQAMVALQTVMNGDPEQGAVLSQEISQALLDYALTLKAVLVDIPDPVKPFVEKALMVSESGAGEELELVGVVLSITDSSMEMVEYPYLITISELTELKDIISRGDTIKVHIIIAGDGTRIAREIELASTDDEDDDIDDDNHNSNEGNSNEDSSDDDLNDNDDESNENSDHHDSDLNDNDDDHMDDDDNDNDNDNNSGDDSKNENDDDDSSGDDSSSNDDDHSGSNDNNSNDNDNEDDENSNDNGNDNSGENDNDDDEKDNSDEEDDAEEGNGNDNESDDD